MTSSPTVSVFGPEWNDDADEWIAHVYVNFPWVDGIIHATYSIDGRFEPPASECLTAGVTIRALRGAIQLVQNQMPFVPGIDDDGYRLVAGLIEPDELKPEEPDE